MNAGLRSGVRGHIRQNHPGPRYINDGLVFHRCHPTYAQAVNDASTATADVTMTLTNDVSGDQGIPVDGSVVALMVHVWVRTNVVDAVVLELMDYHNPRALGVSVSSGDGYHGYQVYGGAVVSHYGNLTCERIYTGGKNNTQFKYGISSVGASTTVTYYVRIMGWWSRANR